jgi:cytochrome d ubiquinol oxidase subunit I
MLLPFQLLFGHLDGEYVVNYQPSEMATIEARWHNEKPASDVLIAWPDVANHRIRDSDNLSAAEVGLDSIPPQNRPPVLIPFFSFRIMVGCGLIMLLVAWLGSYLNYKERFGQNRPGRS